MHCLDQFTSYDLMKMHYENQQVLWGREEQADENPENDLKQLKMKLMPSFLHIVISIIFASCLSWLDCTIVE